MLRVITKPTPSRRPRFQHHWRFARNSVCAAATATVVATLLPVAAAQAAPPTTVAAAQARVDQLNEQAEAITEQYNAAQARLDAAKRTVATANADAAKARTQFEVARQSASRFAAQSYEAGGTAPVLSVVLTGGEPADVVARMSALEQVSRAQGAVLTAARTADQRYRQKVAASAQAQKAASTITKQLTAQKQQITNLLAQSQRVLAQLTAQQRAQMLAAQRAKEAADRARAAAVLAAARQAQAAERASRAQSRPANLAPALPQTANGASVAQRAVAAAMTRLGMPYRWGAAGPNSFDCSGLVQWAYGQAGVATAHYTGAFWNAYRHVSYNELRPGDLVFFYPDHHHVGIYIGNGMMVNAPQTGDVVKVASVMGHGRYSGAVRVVG